MQEYQSGPYARYDDAVAAIEQARREERERIVQLLMRGSREQGLLGNDDEAISLANIATEIHAMPEEASDEP
jgi:hypothetical protein